MANRKIQEWHLDPELLLKLMTGGNAELSTALSDYVKKTDTIRWSQLDTDVLAAWNAGLEQIRGQFRNKNTKITVDDLEQELRNLLIRLEQMLQTTGYTWQQVEEEIYRQVAEEVLSSPAFSDIRDELLDVVGEQWQELENSISWLDEDLEALEQEVGNHITEADGKYRQTDIPIDEEDLGIELKGKINGHEADIDTLQADLQDLSDRTLSVDGAANQIVVIGKNGGIEAADVIEQLDIVTTQAELDTARYALKSPILSFVTPQAVHVIDLPAWNKSAQRTSEEETNPQYTPPEPEPVYHNVRYTFAPDDPELEIPAAVQSLLPAAESHEEGETVTPIGIQTPSVTVPEGIWSFRGWEPEEYTIENQDVTFIGSWVFEAYVEPELYSVTYQTQGEVPAAVSAIMPDNESGYESGMFVTPADPKPYAVLVGSEFWTFLGWDHEGETVEDTDVVFTASWDHETVDPEDPAYSIYAHNYRIQYTYAGTLPDEVMATLPPTDKGNLDGDYVLPAEISDAEIQIANRIWQFVGWSPAEAYIDGANVTFTGTWTYTDLTYRTVHYAYSGAVPASVMATMPADEAQKLPGDVVSPASPSATVVETEDGFWNFAGWDQDSIVIDNSDVTFTGTWTFEAKEIVVVEPEEPRIPLTYADYTLDLNHVREQDIFISDGNTIFGTNASGTNKAKVFIGFYGTRFKLYASLGNIERQMTVQVDGDKQYDVLLEEKSLFPDENTDNLCCLCVENLSEGPHLICIIINPTQVFTIDNKISIDDGNHAALFVRADIPNESFYDNPMFETGKYLDMNSLTGNYGSFSESANIHQITTSNYRADAFAAGESGYERKLLYAKNTQKLLYLTDKGVLLLLSQNQDARLADLENRIAALEA